MRSIRPGSTSPFRVKTNISRDSFAEPVAAGDGGAASELVPAERVSRIGSDSWGVTALAAPGKSHMGVEPWVNTLFPRKRSPSMVSVSEDCAEVSGVFLIEPRMSRSPS